MNDSGDRTHRPRAVDPQRFRAVATGIGQTQEMSALTGARRAQQVADSIPARCRDAVPAAEGYPAPRDPEMYGTVVPGPPRYGRANR